MEEGEDRSSKEGCMFIESSAKAGFNIKALFRKLATALPGMETSAPAQQPAQNCKYNFITLFLDAACTNWCIIFLSNSIFFFMFSNFPPIFFIYYLLIYVALVVTAVIDIKLSAPKRSPEAAAAQPCSC